MAPGRAQAQSPWHARQDSVIMSAALGLGSQRSLGALALTGTAGRRPGLRLGPRRHQPEVTETVTRTVAVAKTAAWCNAKVPAGASAAFQSVGVWAAAPTPLTIVSRQIQGSNNRSRDVQSHDPGFDQCFSSSVRSNPVRSNPSAAPALGSRPSGC